MLESAAGTAGGTPETRWCLGPRLGVEHVTVNWHPSYEIVGGSSHGTGLTSIEDSGFDAGETRDLVSEQSPDGVASGAEIGKCKPSFFLVESG